MRIKNLLFLFILTLTMVSCSSDDNSTPILQTGANEFTGISAEGTTLSVNIESSSSWTGTSTASWISLNPSPDKSKLEITISENLNRDERTATILVSNSENMSQTITIQQDAYTYSENHHYKLPVVFHCLYWRESSEQFYIRAGYLKKVIDGVNKLYQSCGTPINFEFVMATEDPEGNKLEEPGVSREKYGYVQMDAQEFMKGSKPEYKEMLWDPNKYINIMLFEFTNEGVMGISQFPLLPEPYTLDGLTTVDKGANFNDNKYPQCVCINNKYIYDMPENGEYIMSNIVLTVAHELGHLLGLYHAFNQNPKTGSSDYDLDSDFCTDTPPYNKAQYDVKLTTFLSNGGDLNDKSQYEIYVMRTNSDTGEEFRSTNVMDYAVTDGNTFSAQQMARVKYVLQHAVFIPGPKDYTNTDIVIKSSRGTSSSYRFEPHFIE
ncbi:zinc-dependent metalloproteinase lipoprotein [uncultured Bacteroides sp.]|uniref:zinc-dependent metalloproteinase lipoprotein n=1 Tax=uncultured Bacteroides sp. TaxID=162156 RepID=UPI002604B2CF|nr:zinc-dependent metalloproteinase lipoprotein [uncultured Bacteroides sp.]